MFRCTWGRPDNLMDWLSTRADAYDIYVSLKTSCHHIAVDRLDLLHRPRASSYHTSPSEVGREPLDF